MRSQSRSIVVGARFPLDRWKGRHKWQDMGPPLPLPHPPWSVLPVDTRHTLDMETDNNLPPLLGDWVVHWQPHVGFGYPTCSSVLPLLPQPQHKARSLAILAEKVLIVLGLTSLLGNGESGRGGRIKEWHWVGEISNMSFANNNSSNRRRINCSGLFICFFFCSALSF